jgi:hypothetical protein
VEAVARVLSVTVVGLIAFTVVRVLNAVGQLDAAVGALIQILLIPVRLVGVFVGVARSATAGGLTESGAAPSSSGGLSRPSLLVVALLILAGLAFGAWKTRPVLAWLRRRRALRNLRPALEPAPPVLAPVVVEAPAAPVVPAPVAPEGVARVAGWERETPAATVRYLEWLRKATR